MNDQVNADKNIGDAVVDRETGQRVMPEKHKIYCFNNGGSPGWMDAVAIADDGHCLAQHVCSSEGFMSHDLGITSTWKHENYNKHFGEGQWELEWVQNPKTHEGLNAALKLNEQLAEHEPECLSGSDQSSNGPAS